MHADTDTNTDITSRTEPEIFHHSPLKRGCPSSVISGKTTLYTPSEKPGLHGGVPLPSAAICDGGGMGATMSHKSTFKNALCWLQNHLVTFWNPHSCTKASVVFIAGTAIRIMRPKGLSISQKAWLGKNKLHLSPWRGPGNREGLWPTLLGQFPWSTHYSGQTHHLALQEKRNKMLMQTINCCGNK